MDIRSESPSRSRGVGLALCPGEVVEESLLFKCLSSLMGNGSASAFPFSQNTCEAMLGSLKVSTHSG